MTTLAEILSVIRGRYFANPPRPGFLLRSASGRYALHYHAEQSPARDSRITLSNRQDVLGLPFLDVRLKFAEGDGRSVVRAHELLDEALRRASLGRLDFYDSTPEARLARVMKQARDGFHQLGATRMGRDPAESVVDGDCRVHGVENLYVASSAVFPSSGQANPTFCAIALAARLAAHLARRTSDGRDRPSAGPADRRSIEIEGFA
jgi:choline dehydrogenase-like flavoprotein